MGCNCGGGASGQLYLVTRADGTRIVVTGETAARVTVVMAGGGHWRRIDADEHRKLTAEGVLSS